MGVTKDYTVRELGRLELKLRENLVITPQTIGRETHYVIEDPVNSKFHHVGPAEYAFISLLDGQTPIRDVLRLTATASPEYAMSEQEAASICRWLVESELAHTRESSQSNRVAEKASQREGAQGWQRWNPVIIRLPLFHPDQRFQQLSRWLGWMHSRPAFAAWVIVVAIAVSRVAANWDRFVHSAVGILAPGNWLWLLVCWLGLKVIHEIGHGVVCKRYGGSVREVGVVLILFAPIAYVDVTSSWRFRSKWHRIHTVAAGVYVEAFIAALAALVWLATEPGRLNDLCYNVIVMAGFTTFLVNANPLMRFDGYYILSDLIEIPNLYGSAQQYLQYWARRFLFAVDASPPPWSRSRGAIITAYGIAAFCWRTAICACLLIGAASLFHGAGIVIACVAVLMWFGPPAHRCLAYVVHGRPGERPSRLQFILRAGLCTAVIVACAAAPWPGSCRAPAIVEYEPLTVVRANSPGFVREVPVRSGQTVAQGQTLALLDNDELRFELAKLDLEIRQSETNCRVFREGHEMAACQAESENLQALQKRKQEKKKQVDQLIIRAPTSGKILGRGLTALVGTFLDEGTEILKIGRDQHKQLHVSVSQEDLDDFSACVGRPVVVRVSHDRGLRARLTRVDPRASIRPPHPAFSAAVGGPLAVRQKTVDDESRGVERDYELVEPRFTARVALTPSQSIHLPAGQLGTVAARSWQESVGGHLYNSLCRWVRDTFSRYARDAA